MKVRLLVEAETEAQEAAFWYEQRQAGLGLSFLDSLLQALTAIEASPRAFARMEKIRASREVRRVALQRFPYKVIYEVLPNEVLVLAVAHVSRRPFYWRRRSD